MTMLAPLCSAICRSVAPPGPRMKPTKRCSTGRASPPAPGAACWPALAAAACTRLSTNCLADSAAAGCPVMRTVENPWSWVLCSMSILAPVRSEISLTVSLFLPMIRPTNCCCTGISKLAVPRSPPAPSLAPKEIVLVLPTRSRISRLASSTAWKRPTMRKRSSPRISEFLSKVTSAPLSLRICLRHSPPLPMTSPTSPCSTGKSSAKKPSGSSTHPAASLTAASFTRIMSAALSADAIWP
mmetsp:Transcript_43467/g.131459  ORF Transcript_43467/g.131459 Transcript_43467/m.131459 type:complete len:241 (+) Transcript_43467:138-860(+)